MSRDTKERLTAFLRNAELGEIIAELTPDASTRDFFRLQGNGKTLIACVYANGDEEGSRQLVDVTNLFLRAGIPVAGIVNASLEQGIVIIEDLGDRILRDELQTTSPGERDRLLDSAIDLIASIQAATELAISSGSIAGKLRFDSEKLLWELNFFREHYFSSLRGLQLEATIDKKLTNEFTELSGWLEERASVLCHRDFHAANLMIRSDGSLAIIDHQDARIGSTAYDLVSLLLDRITEPPTDEWLAEMIAHFMRARKEHGLPTLYSTEFMIEFDHQTVQRCLKAVGTFSYQSAFRDKKHFEAYIKPMFNVVVRSIDRLGEYPNLRRVLEAEIA
ncbi:MAG: phosphotransferase [Acidobacteria bacterium]|nr:phosphotransferase [Acidobacteriota bacterium]